MSQDRNQGLNLDAASEAESLNRRERSVRSGAITLIEQALAQGIGIASIIILARLLTPEDYGIIAMVTAVTGFAGLFQELGLSSATIQSREITHDQISALFWINAGLGTLITLIIAASGPVLAWFYHKPQLSLVAIGISLTSILGSLGTQHGALLNRQMRFGALAVIRVSALFAGFLAAVIVALSGGTYWALVSSSVVRALWSTCGLWIVSDFRPNRLKRGTGVRSLLRFGANIAAFDIVAYIYGSADSILIGRARGAQELGLYSKAYSLLMLPMQNIRSPLTRVAFPVMSQLQNDPGQFRSYFIKYCSLLAFAMMPIVAFLYACSENVIRLLLGPRWMGTVELFSILALASFILSVAGIRVTVLLALGRGGRYFRWGLYNTIATVAAFFCGLPWGAKGVAIGLCISSYALLHPSLVYAFRDTSLRPTDFYGALAKPCLASIVMCIISLLTKNRLQGISDILVILALFLVSFLTYLSVFWLLPGGKREIIGYWRDVSGLRRSAWSTWSRVRNRKFTRPPQ